jgi:hypothetical protein
MIARVLSQITLTPVLKLFVKLPTESIKTVSHILGIFFLYILLPFSYIQLIPKQVLIIFYHYFVVKGSAELMELKQELTVASFDWCRKFKCKLDAPEFY